jgi:anti-anti-sigma factor
MSPRRPSGPLVTTEDGGRTIVRFPACAFLTEANADDVGAELARLVEGRERPRLSLDLGGFDLLSSIALAKFVALDRRVRSAGGSLTLFNVRPLVRKVFEVTRLDTVLDVRGGETLAP